MVPKYVQLIQDWPVPSTAAEVRSFLGTTSYYRRYIKNFCRIAAPLDDIRNSFQWSQAHQDSFMALKEVFSQALADGPIALPDFSKGAGRMILDTDYSDIGISYVLSQAQRDGGERMIAAGGRKLTPPERNYPSPKGECLAIYTGLLHFEHILRFKPFLLRTDHRSLTMLAGMKNPRGIWFKFINELESFRFEMTHRPGSEHVVPDSFSRSSHLRKATEEEEKASQEFVHALEGFF